MSLPAASPEHTVVVTGASSGIGAELSRQLASVAGAGSFEEKLPSVFVLDAKDVAREAVDGMESGARIVVPGVIHKAHAFSSRFVHNTILLPIAKRLTEEPLAR